MSIAKKAGTSASVTTGHILSSLPTPEETPSHPRRTANPKRRLEQRNGDGEGVEGVGKDLTGERGDMSPIPQLDGGGGETEMVDRAWKDIEDFNKHIYINVVKRSENEEEHYNDLDDDIEAAKMWALSQKKKL